MRYQLLRNQLLRFKSHKKTNLAKFIFADSMYKGSFVDLIFLGGRLRDFYECFITETRNKTNGSGKTQFLWNLLLRLIIRQCFVEFCFAL